MKKNHIFKAILLAIPLGAFILMSSSGGRDDGRTGSPGDGGNSCTACHGGGNFNADLGITTNIPLSGYALDTDYTITVQNTSTAPAHGFQLTAENASNTKVGSFTAGTGSRVTGDRITHTSPSASGNWSFTWRSPATDQGDVKFFSASIAANGTGGTSGDEVVTASTDVFKAQTPESIPYTQNFDAFPQGPTTPNPTYVLSEGWFNETNDDMDWTANSGVTSDVSTGPDSDNTTGDGTYLYIESTAAANKKTNMLSPLIDLNGASTETVLSFFYHMFGSHMGTLEVEISTDLGATFTQLIAPFTDNKNVWQNKTINLSPYIENTVQFRFKSVNSTLGFFGDMAIDDFFVGELPTSVTNVTSSVANGYYPVDEVLPIQVVFDDVVTVTGTPQLTLQTGSTDQVVNYSSGSGSNTLIFDYTVQPGDFTGDLDYVNTFALTLNGGSVLDSNGDVVLLRLPSPAMAGSLSQNKTIKLGEIKTIPYSQNFDAFPEQAPSQFPIYELPEQWFNEFNDNMDWTVKSGATITSNTGPSSDNTTGTGRYIYINARHVNLAKLNMLSPLINLESVPTNTELSFFYHMFGSTMGTLEVEISTDAGTTFTQLIAPFTDNKDEWQQKTISLSPYIGNTVQFRFKGTTSTHAFGDIAIDDFFVGVPPPVTWISTGTTFLDQDWNVGANWSTGNVPSSSDDVVIPAGTTLPIITAGTTVTINNLENKNGPITVESDASVILNSVVDGSVANVFDIQKSTFSTNWHLLSSPVKGETFVPSELATSSSLPVEISTTTNNVGIATYDNTVDADGQWIYYNTSNTNTETFISGDGYAFKPKTGFTIFNFVGTYADVPTTRPISIAQKGTVNENPWNLVGNPYTSSVDVTTFLNDNASVLKPTHQSVYIWNPDAGTSGEYELLTTGTIEIGQSFFVNSLDETGKEITFSAASRIHSVFFFKDNKPTLKLVANDSYTNIKFVENATNGLDPRLDVGTFGGASNSLQLFTKLVSGYEDVDFMQQSLSTNAIDESIVALGVKTAKDTEVEFKLEANNIPSDIYVYLEDKLTGTFTNIVTDSYKVMVTEPEESVGRFYLHTSARALSTNEITATINDVVIYQKDNTQLVINGLESDNASVRLYSVIGKEVFAKKLSVNGKTTINLPSLNAGVYIVNLKSDLGTKTKKIVIK